MYILRAAKLDNKKAYVYLKWVFVLDHTPNTSNQVFTVLQFYTLMLELHLQVLLSNQ